MTSQAPEIWGGLGRKGKALSTTRHFPLKAGTESSYKLIMLWGPQTLRLALNTFLYTFWDIYTLLCIATGRSKPVYKKQGFFFFFSQEHTKNHSLKFWWPVNLFTFNQQIKPLVQQQPVMQIYFSLISRLRCGLVADAPSQQMLATKVFMVALENTWVCPCISRLGRWKRNCHFLR